MNISPQATYADRAEPVECCNIRWGLLGRVTSARGVQIAATDGLPNNRTENHITTVSAVLGYTMRMAADAVLGRPGRSFKPLGSLNYYSPGVSFTLRGSGPFTLSFCVFSPEFLAELAEIESSVRLDNLDLLTSIESEHLTYLGRAMFREAIEPGFASSLFAEATGMKIALEIARYNGALRTNESPRNGGLAPWQLRRLEAYVHDNISGDLTLSTLARLLGVSVRHLSRAVLQSKGVSVHRWIADRRLLEARRLLAETQLPINEIARLSAFRSAAAFSAAFRTASGCAPGEFRRLTVDRS